MYITAGFCPLGLFSFTRCITDSLDICSLWIIGHVQFWQYHGIRYCGFLQYLLYTRATCVLPPEFLRGLCYYLRVFVVFRPSGGFVGMLLVPLFPVLGDSSNLSDRLPCDFKRFPRTSSPWLLLSLSRDEEGLMGFSSLLSDRLTLMAVFTHTFGEKRY